MFIDQSPLMDNASQLYEVIKKKFGNLGEPLFRLTMNHLKAKQRKSAIANLKQEEREQIKHHIAKSPHRDDMSQDRIDLPRIALHRLIYSHRLTLDKKSRITESDHAVIQNHVEHSSHPHNFGRICDELQEKLDLPRNLLYHAVEVRSRRVALSQVSKEQWGQVQQHIENSPHLDNMT
eukprot:CAMPEP_0117451732 /NCGR_PEP_ID=MMETSP0759-20121206/9172_1 /TAXON_ID=63605 /ORGANISM="Percolomonas cosmopolitus, Strain WS" /LENGTH=177 /DNA_ID=CAMNT_0005244367 /DNA_START=394 /DNA_END=924 /DNA_ORIENTATION=+